MTNLTGQYVGQYRIIAPIGEDALSTVYRGSAGGQEVAIKLLRPDLIQGSAFVSNFEQELQALTALNHAHILKLLAYGQQNDTAYLIMAPYPGRTLADLIHQGPVPVDTATRLLDQIGWALEYAHEHHVIHGEVRPANVYLDSADNVVLSDFGVTWLAGLIAAPAQGGIALTTPTYMPPEQWQGKLLTPQTDVYLLAETLFEMLTGHPPFSGETPLNTMYLHLQEPVPSILQFCPDLPRGLQRVLDVAMAKSPWQRFASPEKFVAAFRAVLLGNVPVIEAQNEPEPPRVAPTVTVVLPQPAQAAQTRQTGQTARLPRSAPAAQPLPTPVPTPKPQTTTARLRLARRQEGHSRLLMIVTTMTASLVLIGLVALLLTLKLPRPGPVLIGSSSPAPTNIAQAPTSPPQPSVTTVPPTPTQLVMATTSVPQPSATTVPPTQVIVILPTLPPTWTSTSVPPTIAPTEVVTAVAVALPTTVVTAAVAPQPVVEETAAPSRPAVLPPCATSGVLKVGTDASYPPFESINDTTAQFEGFDIDLISAVGQKAGFKAEMHFALFDTIFTALSFGQYDLVISATTITDSRKQVVNFSDSYFKAGQVIIVRRADQGTVKTLDDLAGKSIGVQMGTTGAEAAKGVKNVRNVKEYQTALEAFRALSNGDVDAVINDLPTALSLIVNSPNFGLTIAGKVFTVEDYGIVVRKDCTALLDEVNTALHAVIADGTYTKIYEKYFGEQPDPEFQASGQGAAVAVVPTLAPTQVPATVPPTRVSPTLVPATPVPTTNQNGIKIGMVTDTGLIDDQGFNQYTWEGIQSAARDLGGKGDYIVSVDSSDYENNIRAFADDDYKVIVTIGAALSEATLKVAAEYPDIHFIGVGQAQTAVRPNVTGLVFAEDQAGFLAGMLAASLSKSGTIAAVVGTDQAPVVVSYEKGYEAGARYVNPNIRILSSYYPGGLDKAFSDPIWGAQTAGQDLDQGADVVFAAAGITGNGALAAVAQRATAGQGPYCIGVDVDEWLALPESHPCLVSSAVNLIAPGVATLIKQAVWGAIKGGNFSGEVGLAPFHDFETVVPSNMQAVTDKALADLKSGKLAAR